MMKFDQFLLFCVSGVVSLTHSILQPPNQLYLIKQPLTWPEAQNYCRTWYTDLATVKDDSVLVKLTEMAASSGVSGPIWIGLYNDINSWRWSLNNLLLASQTLVNWKAGQPDNSGGSEACGGIGGAGNWRDFNCATLRPFICFNASTDQRFIRIKSPRTWTEAQTYCKNVYTDLASSLNQVDNDLLGQMTPFLETSWFGLYRDTWKWLNETVATNIQWGPGQPDNYNLQENCGMLQNGLLNDENCDFTHFFFCEHIPPVKRQTIKLQVKTDGSVLDPAVQSSILELIKKKLEQHDPLVNATVTWRVQPDGNIFYKKN